MSSASVMRVESSAGGGGRSEKYFRASNGEAFRSLDDSEEPDFWAVSAVAGERIVDGKVTAELSRGSVGVVGVERETSMLDIAGNPHTVDEGLASLIVCFNVGFTLAAAVRVEVPSCGTNRRGPGEGESDLR